MVSNGTDVDYVALAFWIDRAPAMVQALIVQSFRSSGRLSQVGTNRDRLRPQFLLRSRTCARSSSTAAAGRTWCACGSRPQLLRMPRRDLVGRESFAAEIARRKAAGVDAVVAAFDVALGRVMKELVAWTVRTGNRAGA